MSASSTSESAAPTEEPLYHIPSKTKSVIPVAEKVYPKPSDAEIEAFRGQLDEWVRMEEQLRKLAVARRECLLRMKALGNGVESFMTRFGYEHINRRDGSKIQYKVREVKKPLTLKEIKSQLLSLDIQQPLTAEALLTMLFNKENREKVVKTSLRRLVPPVPSQLEV
jgi:hypothetical protein